MGVLAGLVSVKLANMTMARDHGFKFRMMW
jgi:hypothetical protein